MNSFPADAVASERQLLERAAAWPECSDHADLTAEALERITQREGVDFATALFFDRFQKAPAHADFIQRINRLCETSTVRRETLDARIVIVPGALYLERPDLGSDGRLVREVAEAFGLETDLIPLVSFGSVAHNAQLIREWLEKNSGQRLVLVSLSKGGPDLKVALSSPDASNLFRDVVAWINVGGPLNGTRMADWILASRWRRWFVRWRFKRQGRDFQFLADLQHRRGGLLDFTPCLPASTMVLSLVGVPLRRHLTSRFARFCHRRLSVFGPNDGTTSLADLLNWPGQIYPVWGVDHYFRAENRARSLIAAVLRWLAEGVDRNRDARRVSASAGLAKNAA
jgi:hypothetical protein